MTASRGSENSYKSRAVLIPLIVLMLATALLSPLRSADTAFATSTGDLDLSFDSDGWNTISGSGLWFEAASVVVQSSGKVVVAGARMNGFQFDPLIARFNTDGTLDMSFGSDGTGIVVEPWPDGETIMEWVNRSGAAVDVALLSDDRIVVTSSPSGDDEKHGIMLFTADGVLDTTFDGDGRRKIASGGPAMDVWTTAVTVTSDDNIMIVGTSPDSGWDYRMKVYRLNTDGSNDTSFNNDGMRNIYFPSSVDNLANAVVMSGDKTVFGGSAAASWQRHDMGIGQLTSDGRNDTAFASGDGRTYVDFGFGDSDVRELLVQDDGKIVAIGESQVFDNDDSVAVTRLNADGSLDTSFSGDGKFAYDFGTGHSYGWAGAIDENDRIVIAGQYNDGAKDKAFVMRLTTAGELDTTFGTGGIRTYDFNSANAESFNAIAVQGGDMVVAGGSGSDLLVARLTDLYSLGDLDGITEIDGNLVNPNQIVLTEDALASYDTPLEECGQLTFTLADGIPPTIGILTPDGAARADSYDPDTHTLGVTDSVSSSQPGFNFAWTSQWALRFAVFGGWIGGSGEKHALTGWTNNNNITDPEGTNYAPVEFMLDYGIDGNMRLYRGDVLLKTSANTFSSDQTLHIAGFDDQQQSDLYIPSDWTLTGPAELDITYDSQNGSDITDGDTTSNACGAVTALPTDPTRTGYTFNGWHTAASDGSEITAGAAHGQDADFTLYAQWTANTLSVTYDSQGGSTVTDGDTTTNTGGSITTLPTDPTHDGYTFTGWYTAASDGTQINAGAAHNQTTDFTLYAQWSATTFDADGDGILDDADNCPLVSNADQADTDSDGTGDACSDDNDGDGVLDGADNCPLVSNADQVDTDSDGTGDACSDDADGDGTLDDADNCPLLSNAEQIDTDSDGIGDLCDDDDDNDDVLDVDEVREDCRIKVDCDDDGETDLTDPFPLAVTEVSLDTGASIKTVPPDRLSTCSLLRSVAYLSAYTAPEGMESIGTQAHFSLTGCNGNVPETVEVEVDFAMALPADGLVCKVEGTSEPVDMNDASISGTSVTYTLTDNGQFDANPTAGRIEDPVTVIFLNDTEPPTLEPALPVPIRSFWLLLAGLLIPTLVWRNGQARRVSQRL